MSTFPAAAEVSPLRRIGAAELSMPRRCRAGGSSRGSWTVHNLVHNDALWALWIGDALKSIGMFIPLVSFVLILRVWRSLGWEMEGSWWGLVDPGRHRRHGASAGSVDSRLCLLAEVVDLYSAALAGCLCLRCGSGSALWRHAALPGGACFLWCCSGSSTRFRISSTCLSICRCNAPRRTWRGRSRLRSASR